LLARPALPWRAFLLLAQDPGEQLETGVAATGCPLGPKYLWMASSLNPFADRRFSMDKHNRC
jgi:hypothetical protein